MGIVAECSLAWSLSVIAVAHVSIDLHRKMHPVSGPSRTFCMARKMSFSAVSPTHIYTRCE
jgi:hypothetical protein